MVDGWMVGEDDEGGASECGGSEFGVRSAECGVLEDDGEEEDEDELKGCEVGVSVSEGDGARLAAERAAEKSDSGEDDDEFGLRNAECGVLEDEDDDEEGEDDDGEGDCGWRESARRWSDASHFWAYWLRFWLSSVLAWPARSRSLISWRNLKRL